MPDQIETAIREINQLASISLGRIFTTSDDKELRQILLKMQVDLVDTVQACLVAAGADPDLDKMEVQVSAAGTKPSHFIAQQLALAKDMKQ